jgi:hypothetical protein
MIKHLVITKSTVSIPSNKIIDFVNTFANHDQEKIRQDSLITTIVVVSEKQRFVEFGFEHQEVVNASV